MTRSFESRLGRLEQAQPAEPAQISYPLEMLSFGQICRLQDGIEAGALLPEEVEHLVNTALERKAAGWTRSDVEKLNAIDKAANWYLWHVILAVGRRHKQPDKVRFDAYDLTVDELADLAELVATAQTAEEIRDAAFLIVKLRLDHRPMTVMQFEAMVLSGILPPPPVDTSRRQVLP